MINICFSTNLLSISDVAYFIPCLYHSPNYWRCRSSIALIQKKLILSVYSLLSGQFPKITRVIGQAKEIKRKHTYTSITNAKGHTEVHINFGQIVQLHHIEYEKNLNKINKNVINSIINWITYTTDTFGIYHSKQPRVYVSGLNDKLQFISFLQWSCLASPIPKKLRNRKDVETWIHFKEILYTRLKRV